MVGRISITERTYETVKDRILSGAIPPGARIDANDIAGAEGVSPTPVRNALNRLVGAGYLVSYSNEGFYAPQFTEEDLRDLYDCSAALLELALLRAQGGRKRQKEPALIDEESDLPIALRTERLFLAVMSLCENRQFCALFADASARLRPARMTEARWIAGAGAEIDRISAAFKARHLEELGRLIKAYHRRRLRYVARIVARLHRPDESSQSHVKGL